MDTTIDDIQLNIMAELKKLAVIVKSTTEDVSNIKKDNYNINERLRKLERRMEGIYINEATYNNHLHRLDVEMSHVSYSLPLLH